MLFFKFSIKLSLIKTGLGKSYFLGQVSKILRVSTYNEPTAIILPLFEVIKDKIELKTAAMPEEYKKQNSGAVFSKSAILFLKLKTLMNCHCGEPFNYVQDRLRDEAISLVHSESLLAPKKRFFAALRMTFCVMRLPRQPKVGSQ